MNAVKGKSKETMRRTVVAAAVLAISALLGGEASAQVNRLIARTTADQSRTATTFTDVTGLSWYVAANTTYAFSCHIAHIRSNFGTELYLSINGPASPTAMRYSVEFPLDDETDSQFWSGNAYDTGQSGGSNTFGSSPNWPEEIRGTFENGANAGTLAIRYMSNTGSGNSVTILRGSFCIVARQ